MAGPILLDRVKETCTVTGLADVTLTGVVTDFKPFLQAGLLVAGDTFHYLIGPTFNEWEVGLGTLIDATSFARTTVYSSSNADNSKVSFTAGTKYAALIADAAVLTEMLNGLIPIARLPIIPLAKGGTNVDLSAGGGSGFVLKQAAGGVISSAALIASDIPALPYLSSLPVHTHLDNPNGGLLTTAAIGSGTFADSFIPNLAASKITSGVFANSLINWASPSAIGGTAAAAGYFSALRLITGGFYGIFAHANSADRTYTLPNFNGTLATLAGTEALSNKTITGSSFAGTTGAFTGTVSTGFALNVGGSSNDPRVTISATGASNTSDIRLLNSAATVAYDWLIQGVAADGRLRIFDNAGASTGERLAIDQSGNFTMNGDITLADAKNLVLNTTTGTKFGTSVSQKMGWWNATPVVQPASAAQASVATTAATNIAPYGFATQAQADAIVTLVNELRRSLVLAGLIKGAA